MENRNLYISILVIGSVFAFLTMLTDSDSLVAISIFYLTILLILILRLIIEWRWYRSHNAPYASEFFLILLSIIAISSSLIANNITLSHYFDLRIEESILSMSINLDTMSAGNYFVFLNRFGLIIVTPFMIILLLLIRKFYTGRYPVIFIKRRRVKKEYVHIYSLLIAILFTFNWIKTGIIEFNSLIFVLTITILIIQKYIIRIVIVPIQVVVPSRNRNSNIYTSRRTTTSPSSSRTRTRPSSQRSSSTSSTSSSRNTSSGVRQTTPTRTITSSSGSSAFVVPGLGNKATSVKRTTKKLSATSLKRIIPKGQHLSDDDFRCIFCYQFPTDTKVVICPHCHYAAHEHEFIKWHSVSQLCSRCNKIIEDRDIMKISGRDYGRLITMFKKRKIQN